MSGWVNFVNICIYLWANLQALNLLQVISGVMQRCFANQTENVSHCNTVREYTMTTVYSVMVSFLVRRLSVALDRLCEAQGLRLLPVPVS